MLSQMAAQRFVGMAAGLFFTVAGILLIAPIVKSATSPLVQIAQVLTTALG